MQPSERPAFETQVGKRIYEYVERHGTASLDVVRGMSSLPPDHFRARLDVLKSKGYIEETDDTLRLGLEVGSVDEYETGEFAYVVRPARPSDFEGIVDAIRDVTAEDTYVVAETVAEQLLAEDTIPRHDSVGSRVFFVAAVDGEVIGWTHLDRHRLAKLRDVARLTVGVREAYRDRGVGATLLQRALDWAEANGHRKVYNSVPATNRAALSFLESRGWYTEAVRENHYTIDDRAVDEVLMAYEF